nr:MAG TPA: hypothetical protein [Bacteriophage sp.]
MSKSSPRPRPILKKKTSIPHLPPTGRLIRRACRRGRRPRRPARQQKGQNRRRLWPFLLHFLLFRVIVVLT